MGDNLWSSNRWTNYFLRLVNEVASMSTCTRRKVGCVIVKDKQLVSTGYNSVPARVNHCEVCPREGWPSGEKLELCRGAHAEQNAIAQAAKHGISVNGATAYVNLQPCSECMKSLINAGIVEVVYTEGYPGTLTSELAWQSGVVLTKVERGE